MGERNNKIDFKIPLYIFLMYCVPPIHAILYYLNLVFIGTIFRTESILLISLISLIISFLSLALYYYAQNFTYRI